MNFKKLNSQSGRSMVEMLGVLAIIGVLSVGGIAGYSLSMRRHRANQIVDYFSKYATSNYSLCQQYLLSGDVNDYNGDPLATTSGCASDVGTKYTEEVKNIDLGPLPAGVVRLHPGMVEFSETGNDEVSFYADFNDEKLCQTVASIVGGTCGEWGDPKVLIVRLKQN